VSATITAAGDGSNPDAFTVRLTGVADSVQLPDSLRAVNEVRSVPPEGGTVRFDALLPGTYSLELLGLAANCRTSGPGQFDDLDVEPLVDLARTFEVTCTDPEAGARPFVVRNSFQPASAPAGTAIVLEVVVDLSAQPTRPDGSQQRVSAFQGIIETPVQVLRFDSASAGQLSTIFTFAENTPGAVTFAALRTPSGLPGIVTVARLHYTVQPGASTGATADTRTEIQVVRGNSSDDLLTDRTRRSEARFTVGPLGPGPGNLPPVARPGGPYTGTAGVPIAFDGSASSDGDGTITTWRWDFGNGATATGERVSYAYPAGSATPFVVTLTVTDNLGATGSATTTATIASGGGGGTNLPPVSRPGGPYSGTVGTPITFDGSMSSDPDGTIVSYAWSFGDGGSASGAIVQHTYAAAGSYTAVLTVTDNLGAQASASTAVTVTGAGGGSQPFVLSGTFSSLSPTQVELVLSLDLTTDIPETPGPEELEAFNITSLRWDPAVLRFFALNLNSGPPGGINLTNAANGQISFSGSIAPIRARGVIELARVRFDVVGAPGSQTTARSTVGALQGTAATGNFSYLSRTRVDDATLTVP
jgi:PKD repeat protein